jgi:hypothetical protein
MSDHKLCIFCGQPGGNNEHIIGKWLLNDLDLYSIKTKMGFGNQIKTGELDEIMQPQPLGSFVTDDICAKCNNGWMSQLESQVKPLLTPLLVDPWPTNDREFLSGLFLKSHVISRWLLKTACTFGVKMSVEVPDYIRGELYKDRLHPEIMADVSCNDQCGFYVGMSRTWACRVEGKVDSMKIPDHSFRFVWQMRHLAMRVAFFPGCKKMMSRPRFPVRLAPKFCIPPDITIEGVVKPAYRYATLQDLEQSTFYERE